jgi:hypothetical protein
MTRNIYGKFWVNFNNLTADRDVTEMTGIGFGELHEGSSVLRIPVECSTCEWINFNLLRHLISD